MSEQPAVVTTRAFLLYISLCVFRTANALLIQTQFDPDEYWQTLEPAYCEAFSQCAYTWEWTRRAGDGPWWMRSMEGPIRSYLSIVPTYIFYIVAKRWRWDSLMWVVPKGPLIVHAVVVAAPTDLATWYIGQWNASSKDITVRRRLSACCLLCSVTSWFNGYALVRTYSNSLEDMLLSVGIALVSPELFGNTARPKSNLRTAIAFVLGGMSVAVRFTSLTAWIPLGILLALQRPGLCERLYYLVMPCALFGLVGIGLSLIVDRYFYGFWTIPFLGSLHFNVIQGLGTLYGVHPAHWYVSSGIPAITGTFVPLCLYDLWTLRKSSCSSQRNAWILIASYTILHSFSAHKEFRFLLPILPLFLCRAGHVLCQTILRTGTRFRQWVLVIILLVLPNMIIVVYLGMFHQRAPIEINQRIRTLLLARGNNYTQYRIHYLMGCHSTPLYSHLHIPFIQMDAWTLDCSPKCRAQGNCESNLFSQDPVRFVEESYGVIMDDDDDDDDDDTSSCTLLRNDKDTCCDDDDDNDNEKKLFVPDFLAVFAGDAAFLRKHFARMGLKEVERFSHCINGLKVGSLQFGDDFTSDAFRHFRLGMLELSVDDMVLFAKPELSL